MISYLTLQLQVGHRCLIGAVSLTDLGIHGQPLVPWDTKAPKSSWYCTHGSPLFPPWHRPYLALYEQRLYEIMLKLIPTTFALEDQPALIHAAETWRFPYWDWVRTVVVFHLTDHSQLFGTIRWYLT